MTTSQEFRDKILFYIYFPGNICLQNDFLKCGVYMRDKPQYIMV